MNTTSNEFPHRKKGFERASCLLQNRIRNIGESRGFAVSRLLTHWAEVVGEDIATMALPVKVNYGRGGLGATLTLLTTGAQAPMLQSHVPEIQKRVNACYGYSAISRIKITQTAPVGFAEGRVSFQHAKPEPDTAPDPKIAKKTQDATGEVVNADLRRALEALGQNILSQEKQ